MLDIVLGVFTGLFIFIYGMHLMTESMKSLSLNKIKYLLNKATNNRFSGFLMGVGVTSLIQSSSAMSVILIGFLNIGLLNLVRTIPIIIGANIGTTITAQLIAFKFTTIYPIFIISGMSLYFVTKKIKQKNIGLAIFGFGLLFFGLNLMTSVVKPLADDPSIVNMFVNVGNNPLLAIAIGLAITAILQSSSATVGIVIALGSAGLIGLPTAFFIIIGDNIGTCVTALIASIGGNLSGKRLALAHLSFNIIGAGMAVLLLPFYFYVVPLFSGDIARQIATSHTLFNIVNAIIFLPLVPIFAKLVKKALPGKDYIKRETKYLDKNLLESPEFAINSAVQELVVMTEICKSMFVKANDCMKEFNYKLYKEIEIDEDSVDDMQRNITEYFVSITQARLTKEQSRRIAKLIHFVNDLERVGDHCYSLARLARRKYESKFTFSKYAEKEINELSKLLITFFKLTIKSMKDGDEKAANNASSVELNIDSFTKKYKENHVKRLRKNICSCEPGLIFTDVLIHMEKIGDHLFNITSRIIEK
jgi:phosphate:Na+ symporter